MIILPPEHMNGLMRPSFFLSDWLQSVWECSQTYLSSYRLPLNSLCQSESERLCNPASSRPREVAGRWGVGGVRWRVTPSRIKAEGRHPAMIIWEAWRHRWLCLFSGQIRGKARREAFFNAGFPVKLWNRRSLKAFVCRQPQPVKVLKLILLY